MLEILNDTVSQFVSTMIHSGTKKGFISHYTSIIFIDLDEDFVVNKELCIYQTGKDETIKTEKCYVVKGRHTIIDTSSNMIRAYLAAFFWVSDASLKSQERFRKNVSKWFEENGGDEDTDDNEEPKKDAEEGSSSSTGNQPERQLSKNDHATGGERKSKDLEGETLKRIVSGDQTLQAMAHKTSEGLEPNEPDPVTEEEDSDSGFGTTNSASSTLSTSLQTNFHISTHMFTKIIPIKLEGLIFEYLKYNLKEWRGEVFLNVAIVNFRNFVKYLPGENRCLFNKATQNIFEERTKLPLKAVLKVYDTDIEEYQEHAEKCYKELKIYEKLRSGMGRYIPELYGAGLFYDETIKIGVPYWRMNGPFILHEYFQPLADFKKSDVTLNLLRNEILPVFEFIHRAGIVHNNLEMENFIFIKSSGKIRFRITDFSESFQTDQQQYFQREIERVYKFFDIPFPN